MVSVFINRFSNTKITDVNLEIVLNNIKNPSERISKRIDLIREKYNKGLNYENLKANLPVITWAGTFSSKKTSGLIKPSNLLYVDVDEKIDATKLPYVRAYWKSVTERGLGILVACNHITVNNYKPTYLKYADILKQQGVFVDTSVSNISRNNVMSKDENLFYNPKSEILICAKDIQPPVLEKRVGKVKNYIKTCDNILFYVLKKYGIYQKGNRHNVMIQFIMRAQMSNISKSQAMTYLISKNLTNDLQYHIDYIYDRKGFEGVSFIDFSLNKGKI